MTHYSDFYEMENDMRNKAQEQTIVQQVGLPADVEENLVNTLRGRLKGLDIVI